MRTPHPRLCWPTRLLVWLMIPLIVVGPGCSRRFYRDWADKATEAIIEKKADDPRWALQSYHVYPDPRARFADTTNPDRPPMPPDDPGAKERAPNPQHPGKAGVARIEGVGYLSLLDKWDVENRKERRLARAKQREEDRDSAASGEPKDDPKKDDEADTPSENPEDLSSEALLERAESLARRELADVVTRSGSVPESEAEKAVSQERNFLIKLEQALELGLINSREYQTRREQLYLAALPVTLERFAFVPQAFFTETFFRDKFGSDTPDGYANRWRAETNGGFTQLFSTGALLLARFANRTVFNLFGGPDTSFSTFSVDLVQPLLYQAGKAVTLEPLTQAERNLLYAIRDFAKFRQDFFVFIAAGQPPVGQLGFDPVLVGSLGIPTRFNPVVSLPLVQPAGSGVPSINPQVVPGRSQIFGASGLAAAPNQGYLSSLVDKATLVNQYRNINSLRRFLRRFRVYLEGGIVNSVQVGQIEQQLLRSIDNALNQQFTYRANLDQFKLQLGLPMNLRLEIDDGPLDPVFEQTRRYEDITNQFEEVSERALNYARPEEAGELRGRLRRLLTSSSIVRRTRFAQRIGGLLREWETLPATPPNVRRGALEEKLEDLTRERNRLRQRRDNLGNIEADPDKEKKDNKPNQPLSDEENRRLDELELQVDLGQYEQALRLYELRTWEKEKGPSDRQITQFNRVHQRFLLLLEQAFRERSEQARQRWPELPALCVEGVDLLRDDEDTVLATITRVALENRLDLMNQRAQVVDSWRKIRVAANALLGTFNVQVHYDTTSPIGAFAPFNLGAPRQRLQGIIDTELPLVRIAQRNEYRVTLISFQQQRRQLQLAEDRVVQEARQQLRQLRASAYSYHNVQKRAVELAYIQVAQALAAFSQPQVPTGPGLPPGAVGPPTAGGGAGDPAALTQQLLNNQNSLLQAQNALYNVWVTYLISRMAFYRSLGVMPLDERGVWIDDVATCHCPLATNRGKDGAESRSPSDGQQPANPGEQPAPLPAPRQDDSAP